MSLKEMRDRLEKMEDSTKINLSDNELNDLMKDYKDSEKITFQKLRTQMAHKKANFPQPDRVQPPVELFSREDDYSTAQRIVKLTADEVKKWGDKIIADSKLDGLRSLLVIDPKNKDVRVLSRNMKTLKKFEDKYAKRILNNMSDLIDDRTILDAELYALGKDDKILHGATVSGWARNPNDEKYDDIKGNIQSFDIVVLNKKDIRKLPLKYRKRLLELSLKKDDDELLEFADTRMMPNNSRLIDWLFQAKVDKRGFEGLVLKDPESLYYYGKKPPEEGGWVKIKQSDCIDLKLKSVESYPYNKPFWFYKHWHMSPEGSDMDIKADKGIKTADMDWDYYKEFSKKMIELWQEGEAKASGPLVPVADKYKDYYGVDKVPKELKLKDGPVVELYVEHLSENLQPKGQKIVRVREFKENADSIEDLKKLKAYFMGE